MERFGGGLLGGGALGAAQKSSTPSERYLFRIYVLVATLVAMHVVLLMVALTIVGLAATTVAYYKEYLSEPLSGQNVQRVVLEAFEIVEGGRNITVTAALVSEALFSSVGVATPERPQGVARSLLDAGDDLVKAAVARLLDACSEKVKQFDGAAPSNFLNWVVQGDWSATLAPKVAEFLTTMRYGAASIGAVLGALGTPVDPRAVGPTWLAAAPPPPPRSLS